jgi:pilus assembly protein CpaF
MGNPDASWWYERDGIMSSEKNISFDAGKLRTGLEVIANQLGKRLDEDNPILHAQLPDGSRLAAVIPPVVRPVHQRSAISKVHQPPLHSR